MFTLLNVVLWGEKCDFAKKLEEIYQLLLLDSVSGMEYKFMPMFCKQVTWAIVHDKCNFCAKRLLPEEFKGGSHPKFPRSHLDDIVTKVMFQEPFTGQHSHHHGWTNSTRCQGQAFSLHRQ